MQELCFQIVTLYSKKFHSPNPQMKKNNLLYKYQKFYWWIFNFTKCSWTPGSENIQVSSQRNFGALLIWGCFWKNFRVKCVFRKGPSAQFEGRGGSHQRKLLSFSSLFFLCRLTDKKCFWSKLRFLVKILYCC